MKKVWKCASEEVQEGSDKFVVGGRKWRTLPTGDVLQETNKRRIVDIYCKKINILKLNILK